MTALVIVIACSAVLVCLVLAGIAEAIHMWRESKRSEPWDDGKS